MLPISQKFLRHSHQINLFLEDIKQLRIVTKRSSDHPRPQRVEGEVAYCYARALYHGPIPSPQISHEWIQDPSHQYGSRYATLTVGQASDELGTEYFGLLNV